MIINHSKVIKKCFFNIYQISVYAHCNEFQITENLFLTKCHIMLNNLILKNKHIRYKQYGYIKYQGEFSKLSKYCTVK